MGYHRYFSTNNYICKGETIRERNFWQAFLMSGLLEDVSVLMFASLVCCNEFFVFSNTKSTRPHTAM